jgi:hypothetical protein
MCCPVSARVKSSALRKILSDFGHSLLALPLGQPVYDQRRDGVVLCIFVNGDEAGLEGYLVPGAAALPN